MMKNNKIIPLNKIQQIEHDDQDIINEINIGLEKVDNAYSTYTPNLQWFEQMVIREKEVARKKFIRDLVIFFIIVITVISLLIITIFHAPIVFLIVQVAVSIGLPLGVYLHHRKRVIET